MTILAVDNENLMLNRLCRHITQIKPDSLVGSFKNPADALAYMENHTVDVVFFRNNATKNDRNRTCQADATN